MTEVFTPCRLKCPILRKLLQGNASERVSAILKPVQIRPRYRAATKDIAIFPAGADLQNAFGDKNALGGEAFGDALDQIVVFAQLVRATGESLDEASMPFGRAERESCAQPEIARLAGDRFQLQRIC
ncbi:hypothetical protein D3C72_1570390 [compost metagenome]